MTLTLPRSKTKRTQPEETALSGVAVLSREDAWEFYDAQAQEFLGISAAEFERRWKRGEFRTRQEDPAVRRVAMVRVEDPRS